MIQILICIHFRKGTVRSFDNGNSERLKLYLLCMAFQRLFITKYRFISKETLCQIFQPLLLNIYRLLCQTTTETGVHPIFFSPFSIYFQFCHKSKWHLLSNLNLSVANNTMLSKSASHYLTCFFQNQFWQKQIAVIDNGFCPNNIGHQPHFDSNLNFIHLLKPRI